MNEKLLMKWELELATQEYAGRIGKLLQNAEHPNIEGFE